MKTNTTTLALARTAAIGAAGIAHAAGNPFALNTLSQCYQLAAADKVQDGKCGGTKDNVCDNGYKLTLMYLVMLVPLVFSGAGKLSVDHWLTRRFMTT